MSLISISTLKAMTILVGMINMKKPLNPIFLKQARLKRSRMPLMNLNLISM